ncbi:hypothetical protein, conserved [Leishmania tarentolae]|uniref:Uncharacterized protein n=1 Tax=Leishmania tarentolae TaxID=5689 RepID=A0A640K8U3_LEITA|nr:hypothetical protein, conserved [Leishmania tarentolae]
MWTRASLASGLVLLHPFIPLFSFTRICAAASPLPGRRRKVVDPPPRITPVPYTFTQRSTVKRHMKLLKFVNSDAPHTLADVQLRNQRLWFSCRHGNATAAAKSWTLNAASPASLSGGYWLLDDSNNPICEITDVLLALPETTANAAGSSGTFAPRGVADKDIDGIDFRSKMGRQMERERATYGATSKTASKSARTMMNAEEVTEKKHERMKRERETVAEAIENNDASVIEPRKKERKNAKK